MSSIDWKATAYDDTYSTTLASLMRRRAEDPSFDSPAAAGVLKHLYVQDGNDWVGRGELQDIVMQATIDAYEHLLTEWRAAGD